MGLPWARRTKVDRYCNEMPIMNIESPPKKAMASMREAQPVTGIGLADPGRHRGGGAGGGGISLSLMIRYGFVGSLNTLASYSVYCLFLYLGAGYPVASLGALVFGIALSFVTLGRYVFLSRLKGRFPLFLMVWGVLYFVNIGIIGFVISLGIDAYRAGFIAAVPTIGLAFLLQRFYVFRR